MREANASRTIINLNKKLQLFQNSSISGGGFRWALGHEGSPIKKQEKVEAPSTDKLTSATPEKKIIKQMTNAQKIAITKHSQSSTRTVYAGDFKQL